MALQQWLANIVLAGLELFLALALAVLATTSATNILDRLTRGIEEWKEIKKGNTAVGILLFAILLAVAIVAENPVTRMLASLQPGLPPIMLGALFIAGLLNLVLATLFSIFAIYIAIRLFDNITVDIDEMGELKKGNVAMALVLAGIILAIAFVAKGAILQLIDAIGLVLLIKS